MENLERATAAIRTADAVLIGAGAGMGVDSGLPDFRGNEGFWNAYPPFRDRGLSFVDMANPSWFENDPTLAWGFYGHRLHLYRDTEPHAGFQLLRHWAEQKEGGCFVFTSNVDGQFQKAQFCDDDVLESHGSIHHMQCSQPCCREIRYADDLQVEVDPRTFRAVSELPSCDRCGAVARPNILMFGDGFWLSERTEEQRHRYHDWLRDIRDMRLVIIECGAGTAVPTVRHECQSRNGLLIRINPCEPQVSAGGIGLAMNSLDAFEKIGERL